MAEQTPRLLVFSALFPSSAQPNAGLFIRERMFRVGKMLPITVVSPVPWFPLQGLVRLLRPSYRPMPPKQETQEGVAVWHPRFLAVPGLFRAWDGFFMAISCLPLLRRLKRTSGFDIIDAHFAYPDGYAATLLGRWLHVPVTITLRGTEVPHSRIPSRCRRIRRALQAATRIFCVSGSLQRLALELGAQAGKTQVVGNGVDLEKFTPVEPGAARAKLGLSAGDKVMVSVGALVPRKGFHRVMDCLPQLLQRNTNLQYLVVGGPSPEGDIAQALRAQAQQLGIGRHVHFLGPVAPAELKHILSAADLFVLATSNEGWANVFLEAMACGLPVVTTDVGGNAEVVCQPALGRVVPLHDAAALAQAIAEALNQDWDRDAIMAYAQANSWDERVHTLVSAFREVASAASHETKPALQAARS